MDELMRECERAFPIDLQTQTQSNAEFAGSAKSSGSGEPHRVRG
jgi:hypothetical protein